MRRLTDNQVACLFHIWAGRDWQVYGRVTANSLRNHRLIEQDRMTRVVTLTPRGFDELNRHLTCACGAHSCLRCRYKKVYLRSWELAQ